MSAFDDLLDLGGNSETTQQSTDPFDPFAPGLTTNESAGNSGGALIDFGFDAEISTENGGSGTVNCEENTNPFFEIANSDSKMASESGNPLIEIDNEPAQKDFKSEPSNLLYEFMQNDGNTNGHAGEGLTNGGQEEVDLFGDGDLEDEHSRNLIDNNVDLLGNSGGPVISDDSGVAVDANNSNETQPEEVIETRNRSSSESSTEPDQENAESVQKPTGPVSDPSETSLMNVSDQSSGTVDIGAGPNENDQEINGNIAEEKEDKVGDVTTEVLGEETSDVKVEARKDDDEQVVENNEQAAVDNQSDDNIVEDNQVDEPVTEQASREASIPEHIPESNVDNAEEDKQAPAHELPPPEEIQQAEDVPKPVAKQAGIDEEEHIPEPAIDNPVEIKQAEDVPEPVAKQASIEEAEHIPEPTVDNPVEIKQAEDVPEHVAKQPSIEEAEHIPKATVDNPDEIKQAEDVPEHVAKQASIEEAEHIPEPTVDNPVEIKRTEDAPEPIAEQASTPADEAEISEHIPEPAVEADNDDNQAGTAEDKQMEDITEAPAVDIQEIEETPEALDLGDEDAGVVQKTEVVTETRDSIPEENALKVNGISEINENGVSDEDVVRDPNVFRETHEKEEVHFEEINNVRQKFESAGNSTEEQKPRKISVQDDFDTTGGEFENEPVQNLDVAKESDHLQDDLPEVGMAKSMLSRFQSIQEENEQPVVSIKRVSPPRESVSLKVEYESQPSESLPQYEGQIESGVFESEPISSEDVVKSHDQTEDFQPEEGSAKNIMNKFKEIQTESSQYKEYKKREITPDRSSKVEYVSEPRGEKIEYTETQTESGVFENVPTEEEDVVRSGDKAEEVLPEVGSAKSLLSKFKQMESDVGFKPPPSPKREITPDRSGKVEYVSEPRGYLEKYEPTAESGEYESRPVIKAEVVRSDDHAEEILPEVGSAKKTMEMFKEIQKQSSSPVSKSKAFTPPREASPSRSYGGVVENTPIERDDVVKSGEASVDQLPEEGTTRNILNKFKEIQSSSGSGSPSRKQKEFTPPPEAGVYENTPEEHLVVETRVSESGVLESTPSKSVADISMDREENPDLSELPEQGFAKNLVSRWKHIESTSSSTKSASPRYKEFTPPRDSQGLLSPKSPTGLINGVHPSDLPGQYQPQESTVIHENKPEVNEDVYRESDTDWAVGMPAPNTTSSMLQRFKSIQEDAKANEATPEPIHRKEKGMFKVVQTEKCAACQKTVYAMEKLEMNGHIYHKTCFKCSHCSARLTAKTFSMNEGIIYCVNHFKQLFARKGNYDEGFGRQQYKKKWQDETPEGATA